MPAKDHARPQAIARGCSCIRGAPARWLLLLENELEFEFNGDGVTESEATSL